MPRVHLPKEGSTSIRISFQMPALTDNRSDASDQVFPDFGVSLISIEPPPLNLEKHQTLLSDVWPRSAPALELIVVTPSRWTIQSRAASSVGVMYRFQAVPTQEEGGYLIKTKQKKWYVCCSDLACIWVKQTLKWGVTLAGDLSQRNFLLSLLACSAIFCCCWMIVLQYFCRNELSKWW